MKERYEITTTDATTTVLTTLMARKDVPADVIQQFSMFAIRLRRELGNERILEHDRQHAHDFQSMATLLEEAVIPQEQRLLKAEAGLAQLTLVSTAAQQTRDARIQELEAEVDRLQKAYKRLVKEHKVADIAAKKMSDARIFDLENRLERQKSSFEEELKRQKNAYDILVKEHNAAKSTITNLQDSLQYSQAQNIFFKQRIADLEPKPTFFGRSANECNPQ